MSRISRETPPECLQQKNQKKTPVDEFDRRSIMLTINFDMGKKPYQVLGQMGQAPYINRSQLNLRLNTCRYRHRGRDLLRPLACQQSVHRWSTGGSKHLRRWRAQFV